MISKIFRPAIAILIALSLGIVFHHRNKITIYAQTLPVTKTASWNGNPASDNVINYTIQLDSNAAISVLSPSTSTPITFATSGAHTLTLTATNMWGTSPATTLNVNVVVPGTPSGLNVK